MKSVGPCTCLGWDRQSSPHLVIEVGAGPEGALCMQQLAALGQHRLRSINSKPYKTALCASTPIPSLGNDWICNLRLQTVDAKAQAAPHCEQDVLATVLFVLHR